MNYVLIFFAIFSIGALTAWYTYKPQGVSQIIPNVETVFQPQATPTPTVAFISPPASFELSGMEYVKQTFNNCGPATLSMVLSYFGSPVSQQELGQQIRPYQHPTGDNDDKSVFAREFVKYSKQYGYEALSRPNGSPELLKKLVANGFPVIVRTWLHPNEDIGHFRIVRGYDDAAQEFIQDDSYEGPSLRYNYDVFMSMWQPFNYGYILLYPKDKEPVIRVILGDDFDEQSAWSNALDRANNEASTANPYPVFNQATAQYHLGNTADSVRLYNSVENQLPGRMLWYQIEPLFAMKAEKQYDQLFAKINNILTNNNRGFSELYQLRGEVYLEQGKQEEARRELEQAVFYNMNNEEAKELFSPLSQ